MQTGTVSKQMCDTVILKGAFAACLIEWLISESVFSLHYLPCGSAWPHWWTDCSSQGDAFRNFQLPVSESKHWHCCVRFRPNGLHFLSLSLQWCWNQPHVSKKVVEGWLVTCFWGGNKGKSDEQASRFIHGSSMNCKWGKNLPFYTAGRKNVFTFAQEFNFKSKTLLFQTCLH